MDDLTIALISLIGVIGSASIGAVLSWIVKSKYERLAVVEQKLRDERRLIYQKVVTMYILLLSKTATDAEKEAFAKSTEYRNACYDLMFIGSDDVVKSFNELSQYNMRTANNPIPVDGVIDYAFWLLVMRLMHNIRKDLGNDRTNIEKFDMLDFKITDIEKGKTNLRALDQDMYPEEYTQFSMTGQLNK